jgi:DNA primase large subunit
LPDARTYVQTQGYTVGELLTDPAYERPRRRALERVRAALSGDVLPEAAAATASEAEIELLSYPLARLILAQLGDSYLNNRYAVAESKLANRRLSEEESDEIVWAVAEGLGIPLESAVDPQSYARLHFLDYLRFAPTRDAQWKLVNQPLRDGFVALPRERVVRLIEEGLREKLVEDLDELERPGREVLSAFGRDLTEIVTTVAAMRARFQNQTSGEIRVDAFPPCMKAIWGGIQAHVNIPHMGRFAIVTFLHKLGMDSEAILKFFAQVPDFDISKSRYQIEHITGKIGGGTEYSAPGCSTMQTYGVCPLEARDDICLNEIHHPLSYYRKKVRRLPPPKPAAAPTPEPAPAPTPEVKTPGG